MLNVYWLLIESSFCRLYLLKMKPNNNKQCETQKALFFRVLLSERNEMDRIEYSKKNNFIALIHTKVLL